MMFNPHTLVTPRRLTGAYLTTLARSLYGEKSCCRFNRSSVQEPVGWYLLRPDDPTLAIGQNIDAAYATVMEIVDSIESAEWLFSHQNVNATAKTSANYAKTGEFCPVLIKTDEITASDLVYRVRHAISSDPQPIVKMGALFYRVTSGVYAAGGQSGKVGLHLKNLNTGTPSYVTKREGTFVSLYEPVDSASGRALS